MTPNYGYGAIDWSTIAADPYFMQLQRNNIAFQAAQQAAAAQAQTVPQTVAAPAAPQVQQIDYAAVKPESSNTLSTVLWTSGALAALTVGGAAIKHGGIGKGLKAIGEAITGKAGKAATEKAAEAAEKSTLKLTAVKGSDGKVYFLIPGSKSANIGGKNIQSFVNRHGLQDIIKADNQKFIPGESEVKRFIYKAEGKEYVVQIEDGYINKISEKVGKGVKDKDVDVTTQWADADSNSTIGKHYQKLKDIIEEFGKEKGLNRQLFTDVSNIRYVNTFGDNTLTLTVDTFGSKTPKLRNLVTENRFSVNSPEMKALKLTESEKSLVEKSILNGTLTDKVQVGRWHEKIGSTVLNFEGNKLVSIKQGKDVFEAGSVGYETFLEDKHNKKLIDGFLDEVFKKHKMKPGMEVTVK